MNLRVWRDEGKFERKGGREGKREREKGGRREGEKGGE